MKNKQKIFQEMIVIALSVHQLWRKQRHLVKNIALSHQGNKIGELMFIQWPVKVSFQGQRNAQNCKNPSKITSFKA